MTRLRTLSFALAGATFLSMGGSAYALDGNDVLSKINAAYTRQGVSIKAATVTTDGDNVVLSGVTFVPVGKPEGAKIGDVTLENVAEDGKGGYTIETAKFADINASDNGMTVTATDMTLGGIRVPADASKDTLDSMIFYETAHVGPVKVSKDGAEVFSLAETTATLTERDNAAGFDFAMSATGLKADMTKVDDPNGKAAIEKLGLQTINGEITMGGSWELASGQLDLSVLSVDLANVGNISLAFSVSGYTLELIHAMQDSFKAMEANPNKQEAQQAVGLAMMGLMQQMNFISADVTFEDDSITKKALDYVASQQGTTGDQLAQTLKGMAPILLAQYNLGELQNQISTALNTFLDDPKNFTIAAAPDKPVPFPVIMGAAMGAPNTVPQVLGVSVSANDDM